MTSDTVAAANLVTKLGVDGRRLAEVCRRYGVAELAVFGSVARGEEGAGSDVDVLVEFAPGVTHGLTYVALEQELSKVFGREVDLATKKWLKAGVRGEILADAVVIYAAG